MKRLEEENELVLGGIIFSAAATFEKIEQVLQNTFRTLGDDLFGEVFSHLTKQSEKRIRHECVFYNIQRRMLLDKDAVVASAREFLRSLCRDFGYLLVFQSLLLRAEHAIFDWGKLFQHCFSSWSPIIHD